MFVIFPLDFYSEVADWCLVATGRLVWLSAGPAVGVVRGVHNRSVPISWLWTLRGDFSLTPLSAPPWSFNLLIVLSPMTIDLKQLHIKLTYKCYK